MVSIGKLNYELGLDTKDFVKGAKATQQEMRAQRRIMRETDTAADKYEKSWKDIQNAYKKGHISADRARRALDKLNDEFKKSDKVFDKVVVGGNKWSKSLNGMLPSISAVTVGTLGAEAAMKAFSMAIGAARSIANALAEQFPLIDEIAKVSRRLGIATEELIGFRFAAAQMSGMAGGEVDQALQRMIRRISQAANMSGEAKAALEELGLSASQLNKDPMQALFQIADALAQVESQADRVRLAQKLFDSEGVKLVTTLQEGRNALIGYQEAARELGLTFSEIDAAKVEELNDSLHTMEMAIQGIKTQAAIAIADDLNGALQGTLELVKAITPYMQTIMRGGMEMATMYETGMFQGFGSAAAGPLGGAVGGGMVQGVRSAGLWGHTVMQPLKERERELDQQMRDLEKKRKKAETQDLASPEEEVEYDAFGTGFGNGPAENTWESLWDSMEDNTAEMEKERADRKRHNEAMDKLYEAERKTYEEQLAQIDKEIEAAKKAEEDRLEHNKRVKESRDHDILVAAGSQRARTMELRARGFGPKKEVQQVRIADDQLDELVKERETIVEMEDEVGRPV